MKVNFDILVSKDTTWDSKYKANRCNKLAGAKVESGDVAL